MRDLLESFERFCVHTLGGCIRGNEIGELRVEIDKLLVQSVVFSIADYRRGFLVIKPVVLPDFLPQLLDALGGFLLFHEYPARYERAKSRQRWAARRPGQSFKLPQKQVCIKDRETGRANSWSRRRRHKNRLVSCRTNGCDFWRYRPGKTAAIELPLANAGSSESDLS